MKKVIVKDVLAPGKSRSEILVQLLRELFGLEPKRPSKTYSSKPAQTIIDQNRRIYNNWSKMEQLHATALYEGKLKFARMDDSASVERDESSNSASK